jgi:hypothetical protein
MHIPNLASLSKLAQPFLKHLKRSRSPRVFPKLSKGKEEEGIGASYY